MIPAWMFLLVKQAPWIFSPFFFRIVIWQIIPVLAWSSIIVLATMRCYRFSWNQCAAQTPCWTRGNRDGKERIANKATVTTGQHILGSGCVGLKPL